MENKRKASGGDIKQSRDTKNRRRYVQHLRGTKQPHDGAQHSHEDLRRWHKKHFLESFVLRTNLYPGPLSSWITWRTSKTPSLDPSTPSRTWT
ncbi:hypothetical protein CcaverHIS631_0300900 [Cutaneotrichosporon cavernicola]|nr:hypothetical protein CcaverHIS631_0300900 [Cutaneotrichosporon cavernicola]